MYHIVQSGISTQEMTDFCEFRRIRHYIMYDGSYAIEDLLSRIRECFHEGDEIIILGNLSVEERHSLFRGTTSQYNIHVFEKAQNGTLLLTGMFTFHPRS